MEIQYERDDSRQLVMVTLRGGYQPAGVLALLERHRLEDDWSYRRLYDLRSLTGQPTVAELRKFLSLDTQHQPHGPEAILTNDPILYALACTYAALSWSTLRVQVFRDTQEAAQWLALAGEPG